MVIAVRRYLGSGDFDVFQAIPCRQRHIVCSVLTGGGGEEVAKIVLYARHVPFHNR